MRSKQYFTSIKNNPHEISTDPDYADSMFNFNLSVKIYRSIDYQKKQKNNK